MSIQEKLERLEELHHAERRTADQLRVAEQQAAAAAFKALNAERRAAADAEASEKNA